MVVRELDISVLEAAEKRILEVFNRNKLVCISFSGGKDSICLSEMVIRTMQKYGISFSRLMVIFFDEEAIYPDVEQIVLQWRSRFMSLGAKFYWFCLPIRHYNCCNRLANDESFICWEPGKESLQRRITIGSKSADPEKSVFNYPIYDWADNDVWLFIKLNGLEIPKTYLYLYKVGVPLNKLRISQFFSVDTIKSLPKVMEFYPDLYQRVLLREPNADLVMLYWDTDMFRSSKQDTKFGEEKDYKTLLRDEMKKAAEHPESYAGYVPAKRLYSMMDGSEDNKTHQKVYQILVAGDPKKRTYRVVIGDIKSKKK